MRIEPINSDIGGPIILYIGLTLMFYFFIIVPVGTFAEKVVNDVISFFTPKVISFLINCLWLLLALFVIYVYTRIVIKIKNNREAKRKHRSYMHELKSRIAKLIKTDLEGLEYGSLKSFTSQARDLYNLSIEYGDLEEFTSQLRKLLNQARKTIEIKEHKMRISELEQEERIMKRNLEELDKQIYLKQIAEEEKKREFLRKMNTWEHPVFKRDDLNEKEVVALIEEGYSKVNEYCIIEKKLKTFLIDPTSNHSKTHTFLVWNVKELLKRTGGVESIREHESVDADLTFKYKSKVYAIEIETGTLLGKKKQTQDKIDFLNQKYPNRWFFVVSDKTLLSKYSQLGVSTQRNGVLEKLQKMLK